jgi:hypothetical protein
MLSLDQFKSLPLDELAALWREYVAAMAELLPHARSDPGCPAVARVVQLAKEVRVVVSSLMAANPKNWSTLRWGMRIPLRRSLIRTTALFQLIVLLCNEAICVIMSPWLFFKMACVTLAFLRFHCTLALSFWCLQCGEALLQHPAGL